MSLDRAEQPHLRRKQLWFGATGLGLVLLIVVAHESFVRLNDGSHRWTLGEDFVPVYAAGTLVREGRAADLYKVEPIARIEHRLVTQADLEPLPVYGLYFNPPFFAALYAPLSALPYRQAAVVWLGLNLFFLSAAAVLLCRMLPAGCGWTCWGLVPLLIVLPLPFWQAMCHQQNTFLSLLLLSIAVTFWRSASTSPHLQTLDSILAGITIGFLFYKPQLALVISVMLVLTLGWRAALGLAITGIGLLLFTLLAMPQTLGEFLHRVPPTVAWMQNELAYNWGRQVTPHAFWRLVFQGHAIGPTHPPARILGLLTNLIVGSGLALAAFRSLRRRATPNLDLLIAATIVSIPMLMPYFMDYDLLLLAVPAVLLAADRMESARPRSRTDSVLFCTWLVLFLALYANPAVAGHTPINPAVPVIGMLWAGFVRQLRRSQPDQQSPPQPQFKAPRSSSQFPPLTRSQRVPSQPAPGGLMSPAIRP